MDILTIDFDITQEPSLLFCNDLIGKTYETPLWQEYLTKYPILQVMSMDYKMYFELTSFIYRQMKIMRPQDIFFIKEHDEVYSIINDDYDHSVLKHVINLDHHHDIAYEEIDNDIIIPQHVHPGNWVKALYDANLIQEYTWVHNSSSSEVDPLFKKYLTRQYNYQNWDINTLYDRIDVLIICDSPAWRLPQFNPFWDNWINMAREAYDYRLA